MLEHVGTPSHVYVYIYIYATPRPIYHLAIQEPQVPFCWKPSESRQWGHQRFPPPPRSGRQITTIRTIHPPAPPADQCPMQSLLGLCVVAKETCANGSSLNVAASKMLKDCTFALHIGILLMHGRSSEISIRRSAPFKIWWRSLVHQFCRDTQPWTAANVGISIVDVHISAGKADQVRRQGRAQLKNAERTLLWTPKYQYVKHCRQKTTKIGSFGWGMR